MCARLERKKCSLCAQELLRYEFSYDAGAKDGLQSHCRECANARARILRKAPHRRAARAAYARRRRAENIDLARQQDRAHYLKYREYYLAKNTRNYGRDREKHLAYKRDFYASNLDLMRERTRTWRRNNPDQSRLFDHVKRAKRKAAKTVPFTREKLEAKFAYWGNKCWMCGGSAQAADHVKPLSRGGWHVLSNIRPACHSCNSKKKNKWPFLVAAA